MAASCIEEEAGEAEPRLQTQCRSSAAASPLAQLGDCLLQRRRRKGCRAPTPVRRLDYWRSFRSSRGSCVSPGRASNHSDRSDGASSFVSTSSTATDLTEGDAAGADASHYHHSGAGGSQSSTAVAFRSFFTSSSSGRVAGGAGASLASQQRLEATAFRDRNCFRRLLVHPEKRRLQPSAAEGGDVVVRSGMVLKRSRHLGQWRGRWAILTRRCFVTFKEPTALGPPTEYFELSEVLAIEAARADLWLRLRHREFELRFQEPVVAELWANLIQSCCEGRLSEGANSSLPLSHASS